MKTDASTDRGTRERVARLLLEGGPATAAALGERLRLTPAAVRRHLDTMLAEGTIVAREPRPRGRRGRGRPARVFALSDSGHAALHNAYDDLAAAALAWIRGSGGEEAVTAFAQARIADLERRYAERVAGSPPESRADALAAALTDDGYAASTERAAFGVQICQHHCPVQHVAEQFPQLCGAETAAFGRLLGTHVQRLATIAHEHGVCKTHVPATSTPALGRTSP